ncbi:ABC transporter [Coprinopsis cinerea okayama7|uniref:ABC transporter n=1 Tax=Coprinopsis cinerea (strain Okayama-7 / 130 / ATCC MYA-4618 / FGSC 9003) TaxID=240176 RepID=A8NUS2_COPC7|nr:ABC transporter [Coprinopsis cinerea okayama7\|eukprot:XP_001836521.2 ABC transporter [Coprinopsis cinerea okayama7\
MAEHIPLANISEEASLSRATSFKWSKKADHHDADFDDDAPPTSPKIQAKRRNSRRMSTASRVSIDFFDPQGVEGLRRSMTREKQTQPSTVPFPAPASSDASSDDSFDMDSKDFDLEKWIRQMIQRRSNSEAKPRQLGVVFRDLQVLGIGASASYQPTLGSVLNPLDAIRSFQTARHPPIKEILTGFEGVVRPGEMLLVLGSPGAGCSTFLKTLANHRAEYHAVNGEVHYDSISPEELHKYFRGDVQYCPEDDIHFPTLTVDQTIKFAARTRTPRHREEFTRAQFTEMLSTVLTTVFGLRHVRNTMVGDAAIRGVSGGQKKRVSIAESLATRACMACWDNSTRGLDASTALEFVRALRIATDAMQLSTVVSIYQAGESLYKHFDKVCVIYEGRMAYFGPAHKARDYFIEMGYQPANRQTTPDFLVSVTDPGGRLPVSGVANQPRTADEFAAYFKASQLGRENQRDIEDYIAEHVGKPDRALGYMQSARAEFAKRSGKKNPYMLTIPQQVAAVMRRKVQILRGDMLATFFNTFSFVFQAIIMGSLFLRMPERTSAFFSRGGVLFFSLLFSALATMAEIPSLYSQRRIVLRHKKAALYHPFVEALAHTLVDIPIAFCIISIFSVILYFMTGLQRSAEQFFTFLLFLLVMAMAMKSWFRALAAAFKSEATAQSVAGIAVLALCIYTGYTIPKPSMIGALRWITYINPLRYGFESILVNEFRTLVAECDALIPQGPGYENITLENQVCAVVGAQPGESVVNGARFAELSYGFKWSNVWMNLGIIIAFLVGFMALLLLFSEYNTSTTFDSSVTLFKRGTKRVVRSKSDEEEKRSFDASSTSAMLSRKKGDAPLKMNDTFTWKNLNYTVPIPGEDDRQLLSNVSGYVAPGKLTALMGESGAGKTTLLNVLARRVDTGVVTGEMFVNGQALPRDFQSQTGYCQQMDTHVGTATVREALLFSAKLRQPASVPLKEKEAYVEQCIKMCGLDEYADAIVGSLNVEYRKRTTIAVELAAKPKLLLFLDEPTSGLDSQSAWAIVSFLRSLADQGQAILCTFASVDGFIPLRIHQPSAELFQVFDRMLLLKKGGQTVYFGDLGPNSSTLIQYFERNGARKCDPSENPAEYMLDVIGAGATATTSFDWYSIWKISPEAACVQQEIEGIYAEGRGRPAVEATLQSEFATSWGYQVKELFYRNVQSYWRDPTYLMAKLVLNAFGGLFVGFTFFNAPNTQQGTQNKLFAIFMITILSVPLASQLQVPFINLRSVYEIRERPSRMYSWTALITSQILIEVPWNILGSIILFVTWYWTVGFDSSRAGYSFLLLGIIYPIYYTTIGQAVAAMSPNAEIAAMLFSLLFSFVLSFNGVMQPYRALGWWKWMYRLSPFTYLIEGLLGQAIGRQAIRCSPVEFVQVKPPSGMTCGSYLDPFISMAGGYLTNPDATSDCNYCSMSTTDHFLMSSFNISYDNRWRNVGLMVVFTVFNFACVYALTYLFRIHKGSLLPSFKRSKKKN